MGGICFRAAVLCWLAKVVGALLCAMAGVCPGLPAMLLPPCNLSMEVYAPSKYLLQVSYTSWFLDAFNYAMALKMNIVNLSIGAGWLGCGIAVPHI